MYCSIDHRPRFQMMPSLGRFATVLLGVAVLGVTSSQTGSAQDEVLRPFLTQSTLFVGRIDLEKAGIDQVVAEIRDLGRRGEALVRQYRKWQQQPMIQALRDAKVRTCYIIVDAVDLRDGPGFLVLPVASSEKAEALAQSLQKPLENMTGLFRDDPNFRSVRAFGSTVVVGHPKMLERLAEVQPADRSDIVRLLNQPSDAPFSIWFVPTSEYRELVAEFPLPLPPDLMAAWDDVCEDYSWVRAHISVVPRLHVQLEVKATDEDAAKKWEEFLSKIKNSIRGEIDRRVRAVGRPPKPSLSVVLAQAVANAEIQREATHVKVTLKGARRSDELFALGDILAAVTRSRQQSSLNQLKLLAIAMHNFHHEYRSFPPAASYDANGRPLLSWRVHLLPYLEEIELYKQFRLDEPWDSPHNKKLIAKMPKVFADTSGQVKGVGKTRFVAPVGEGFVFDGSDTGHAIKEIFDGTSNTIMLVEAAPDRAVIWTKPEDLVIDKEDPRKGLIAPDAESFRVIAADGAVHTLPKTISGADLLKLLTIKGREVIRWPER